MNEPEERTIAQYTYSPAPSTLVCNFSDTPPMRLSFGSDLYCEFAASKIRTGRGTSGLNTGSPAKYILQLSMHPYFREYYHYLYNNTRVRVSRINQLVANMNNQQVLALQGVVASNQQVVAS